MDSRQKSNNTGEDRQIITSAKLQTDANASYQVGLNLFEELTNNYNRDLKRTLLSKCQL